MLIAYISSNKKTTSQQAQGFIRDLKLEKCGIPLWSYLFCMTDFSRN